MKKSLSILILLSLISCRVFRDSLYQSTNTYIGTAVNLKRVMNDTAAIRVLKSDFNSITAENAMKMHAMFVSKDSINWVSADEYVNFAKRYNMRIHGHALVWHYSVPKWMNEYTNNKDTFEQLLSGYIKSYVGHYKNDIFSWDVVNEAITDSGGLYRNSIWYNVLGSSYIEKAFRWANEASPNALLFYNDYGIENDTVKLKAVLQMIDSLTAKNVPIHGIGLQMHISIDTDMEKYKKALQEFVKRGLLVHISELDVSLNQCGGQERFKRFTHKAAHLQKEKYYEVVKTYLQVVPHNQQYGITMWGYSDGHSWIPTFFKRHDWPCIYDDRMKRKPAYNGFWKALNE